MTSSPPPTSVIVQGRQYRPVREGLASILAPYRENGPPPAMRAKNNDEGDQAVFYNPIQQFNRDLSVLAILKYGEGAILEKEARFTRKQRSAKNRKEKAKNQRKSALKDSNHVSDTAVTNAEPVNEKKRKADQLQEDTTEETAATNGKKPKIDEFEADDEELEVMQLNGTAAKPHNQSSDSVRAVEHKNLGGEESNITKQRRVPFTILDALSATGLRALRYAQEIPFATNIIANDLSPEAVKSIELNIDHNQVGSIVHSNVGDARAFMYSKIGNEHQQPSDSYVHRFDVIDLDPYGTAAPFLDSSLQALQDGGLLCVTCTDAGVFASNGYPEKAYALYGGITVKGAHSHEGGLRLILNAVASTAAKYGIAIEPLLSLSIDFYARLFIRIHKQPKDVKLLAGTIMNVYNCDYGCGAWTTQTIARNQAKEDKAGDLFYKISYAQAPTTAPLCEHCGTKTHLGGPMWAGPLHNPYFVQRILDKLPSLDKTTYGTIDRLKGMLTLALEEDLTLASSNTSESASNPAEADTPKVDPSIIPRLPPDTIDTSPFFFIPNYLAKVLHCATPPEDPLRGAIRHLGYRVTRSHCKPGSFKTNAPWAVLWEIMREWVRTKAPIKEGAVKENTPGWKILARMRHTEQKFVSDIKDDLKVKMDKCESVEDLNTLMRSAMWRLEHEKITDDESANRVTENGIHNDDAGGADRTDAVEPPDSSVAVKSLNVVFDEKLGKEKPREKLVRYQINPRANWGPMNRAGGGS